jgi:hypothetical protein
VIDANNTDYYPLMKPWAAQAGHCVEILSAATAKTVVGQGFSANMTVCVADNGEYAESFNVTAYANSVQIISQQVSLNASCQTVLRFAWNTTSLAYGNYTINAYAQPVSNQTNIANNNFTGGWIILAGDGDVAGSPHGWPDAVTDISDISIIARSFMTAPGSSLWNPNADINNDGVIDISDISIAARHFMQTWPYPPYP